MEAAREPGQIPADFVMFMTSRRGNFPFLDRTIGAFCPTDFARLRARAALTSINK
jgi:hypothetical protein